MLRDLQVQAASMHVKERQVEEMVQGSGPGIARP